MVIMVGELQSTMALVSGTSRSAVCCGTGTLDREGGRLAPWLSQLFLPTTRPLPTRSITAPHPSVELNESTLHNLKVMRSAPSSFHLKL
jgi:hypothetical protein